MAARPREKEGFSREKQDAGAHNFCIFRHIFGRLPDMFRTYRSVEDDGEARTRQETEERT